MTTRSDLRDEFAMADDVFALSPISARAAQPSEADYEAIRDAFMETSRGRWFLGEYTKRNRNADTSMVLDAVARIEHALSAQREQQQEQQQLDQRALPEALAAIRGAVEDAALASAAAIDGLALEQNLAPLRKGTRIIKEISWRWREIGADSRICDLIDAQMLAIEAACEQLTSADPKAALAAAFEIIKARLNALEPVDAAAAPAHASAKAEAAAPPAVAETEPVGSPVEAAKPNAAATNAAEPELAPVSPTSPPRNPADVAVATATVAEPASEPVAVVAQSAASAAMEALPQLELTPAPVADDDVEIAAPTGAIAESEIAGEAVAATAEATAELDAAAAAAQDEALLELVAAEMAAPDPVEDDEPARVRTIGFDIEERTAVDDDIVATFAEPVALAPAVPKPAEPAMAMASPGAAPHAPLPEPEPTAPRLVATAGVAEPVTVRAVAAAPAMPAPTAPEPVVAAAAPVAAQAVPTPSSSTPSSPEPSFEASLGSTLIANGLLARKPVAANDPLTPIRRMTQPEKIAFFS